MNKWLFYLVMAMLIVTSLGTLTVAGVDKNPTEFIAILIVCLALTDVFLTIVEGWDIWTFLGLLGVTFIGAIIIGGVILTIYPFVFANFDTAALEANTITYGIRTMSSIWPIAVLIIGVLHYENSKKPKEEK
jgi:hypothetical protein